MVLRNDGIATAEKELRALHEREEKLKELLEVARREHNEAVADRHRAADSDESDLAGIPEIGEQAAPIMQAVRAEAARRTLKVGEAPVSG